MNKDNKLTVWITKYALTYGIEAVEAELRCSRMYGKCKRWLRDGELGKEGRDWHYTEASAIARAEEMRIAKIASLKKKIAKLEKMKFGE